MSSISIYEEKNVKREREREKPVGIESVRATMGNLSFTVHHL